MDKPVKLSDAESTLVKEHPAYLRRILERAAWPGRLDRDVRAALEVHLGRTVDPLSPAC